MNLVYLLYPKRCPGCDEILGIKERSQGFCHICMKEINYVKKPICAHCGRPLKRVEQAYCKDCQRKPHFFLQGKGVYVYQGPMRQAMYRFKYQNRRDYAKVFANDAWSRYGDWIVEQEINALIPIPMYAKKERKRGYNQAKIFAKELSKLSGIPLRQHELIRKKDTIPLKSLNPSQRKKNLKNAFIFRKNVVQYENALLIDDIYTTGATMEAASLAMHRKGFHKIFGLYICIGKGDS